MNRFTKANIIFGTIFSIIAAIAVCYFAEHDRKILLFGVYPAIALIAIGFVGLVEKNKENEE